MILTFYGDPALFRYAPRLCESFWCNFLTMASINEAFWSLTDIESKPDIENTEFAKYTVQEVKRTLHS